MRGARVLATCRNAGCPAYGTLTAHMLATAKDGTPTVAICNQCGHENPRPAPPRPGG